MCDIKTFSFIWWFTFLLLSVVSFDAQNFSNFIYSSVSIFCFWCLLLLGVIPNKVLSNPILWSHCPVFLQVFYGFKSYFWVFNPFEVIFVCGIRTEFICWIIIPSSLNTICWRHCHFSILVILASYRFFF